MEKTSLMQGYNQSKNEPLLNIFVRNQEEDLLTADRLKLEQERLVTVLESHNNSSEFKPIGNKSQNRGYHCHS